jgi:Tfp pilus assembly protein PilN
MAQQINLCSPILLTQKRYFSAQAMVSALGVFVVLGGILCGAWVWNLHRSSVGFSQAMGVQSGEVESLKSAIQRSRANAAPVDAALMVQLQDRRAAVVQREQLLAALQQGISRPGWGHSDRLQWVARSIPAPVWVSEVRVDGGRFEVSGFTLEPAALNDWVAKLSASPLMQGLKLATVKVESATAAQIRAPGAAASEPAAPVRPVWSFNLVSVEPPPGDAAKAPGAPGSKP